MATRKKPAPKKTASPRGGARKVAFASRVCRLPALRTFYLEVPASAVEKLGGKFKLRVHVKVEGRKSGAKLKTAEYRTGLMALGQGRAYVAIKSKLLKDLGLAEGDAARATFTRDESKFGMDMPAELRELFRQEREGKRRFDGLKPGMQRYILYYVNGVKNPEKRLERAMLLVGNLIRLPEGKIHFRQLLGKD